MGDKNFETLLERLNKIWYYVIKTEDDDRYVWEVYAKDELVCIATSSEEAYMKLWEFAQHDLADN